MTTTTEFKSRHNLSDSAFKRLVSKVKAIHPDLAPFTERSGSTAWTVNHEQVLEAHLGDRATEESTNTNNQPRVSTATDSALANLSVAIGNTETSALTCDVVDTPTYALTPAYALTERQLRLSEGQRQLETMRAIVGAATAQLMQQQALTAQVERQEQQHRRQLELEAIALDERLKQAEELRIRREIAEEFRAVSDVGNDTAAQLELLAKAFRK
jgi:hypothetical protein